MIVRKEDAIIIQAMMRKLMQQAVEYHRATCSNVTDDPTQCIVDMIADVMDALATVVDA